jgi:hypothetical protein
MPDSAARGQNVSPFRARKSELRSDGKLKHGRTHAVQPPGNGQTSSLKKSLLTARFIGASFLALC